MLHERLFVATGVSFLWFGAEPFTLRHSQCFCIGISLLWANDVAHDVVNDVVSDMANDVADSTVAFSVETIRFVGW